MTSFIDLTAKRFGRLVAFNYLGRMGKNPHGKWLCKCDCGRLHVVAGHNLRTGQIKSCGCIQKEHPNATRHGMCYTTSGNTWRGMRGRCQNPKHKQYSYYGGRGISVCERWQTYENFLADMGAPLPGYSIDRIDNDGDYTPDNCRWATPKEQALNRRRRRMVTHNGETLHISEWAERSGIRYSTIALRLKAGWTPKQAIESPVWSLITKGKRCKSSNAHKAA